ncbi:MAG: SGNH/GDSL hydrolase family protein [Oscillospiraceae bacterium]|nr:SGNH/GDSL hydrolase family protein [Oscillospiraceae bacterium]
MSVMYIRGADGKLYPIETIRGPTGPTGPAGKDAKNLLEGKKIVYDGDSICESRTGTTANNGGGYAKIIADTVGGTYVNNAVSGALLSSSTERHSVVDSLSALPTDGDLYCFEGGYNDYWQDVPVGTCDSADYTGAVDTSTICGALESIFRYCLSVFVGRPVCFVIVHKCQNTGHTANSTGKTFKDYRDVMIQVCEKYSIPYYDAFTKSGLNGWNEAQSNAYLTASVSGDSDGVHPNEQGYKRYYVPQLIALFISMMPANIIQDDAGDEPETEAVNQIPISIDTDGSVFNGKGWIENRRVNSSGTEKDADGYNLTGFIPLSQEETLTIESGVWGTLAATGTYNCFIGYDSTFAFIGAYYYGTVGVTDNGDGSITFVPAQQTPLATIAYARICGDGVNENAVATKR